MKRVLRFLPLVVTAPIAMSANGQAVSAPVPCASATCEGAASADTFVDSMGVNAHWTYTDTPYGSQYGAVRDLLVASGLRHVRSDMSQVKDLGAHGIRTTVVADLPNYANSNPSVVTSTEAAIKAANTNGQIDAVEGPNEPNIFWVMFQKSYNGNGYPQYENNNGDLSGIATGTVDFQIDMYSALKADPATASLLVYGPAMGIWARDTIFPANSMTSVVDFGNFHPYPFGGNSYAETNPYDSISRYFWYGNQPSVNIDDWPRAFAADTPPFGSKPMVATETGYFTTSQATNGVSEKVQGKYMPRLFAEYFRKGIRRTFTYELVDEHQDQPNTSVNYEDHFGLVRNDLTPKPAYMALKNVISVLSEKGASFTPTGLDYSMQVSAVSGYDRTNYLHHLLLQKSNGSFYLLLWHEISDADVSTTPATELNPPALPVALTFKTPLQSATLYTLDDAGNLSASGPSLVNNSLSLSIPDKLTILQLDPIGVSPYQPVADGTYQLTNQYSGFNLDDPNQSTTQGMQMVQAPANGGSDQNWTLNFKNGFYTIQNGFDHFVLGDPGGSTANGTACQQQSATDDDTQLWSLTANGNGWTIKNKASGLVIDDYAFSTSAGTPIALWSATGNQNQIWKLQ